MLSYRECSNYERNLLRMHEKVILNRIDCVEVPKDLKNCIKNLITGTRDIIVDCNPERTRCTIHEPVGIYVPGEIEICTARSPALFFHELVHSCGGNEFDAEVYENILFTSNEGATRPDPDSDRREFENEEYRGRYAYLDGNSIYNSEGRYLMRRYQLIDW